MTRILKAQLKGRLLLTEAERATLGGIGHRLGRKALEEVAAGAKPETILGRYRRLIAPQVRWFKAAPLARSVPVAGKRGFVGSTAAWQQVSAETLYPAIESARPRSREGTRSA